MIAFNSSETLTCPQVFPYFHNQPIFFFKKETDCIFFTTFAPNHRHMALVETAGGIFEGKIITALAVIRKI